MTSHTATIVITTRNRREDLCVALASALTQEGSPEVVVLDDGSTDGTAEMVRAEFPSVVLHRDAEPRGLIAQRNRGAMMARGDVIVSIDDDAAFPHPDVVARAVRAFDHPRVGAVAIPFVDVNASPDVRGACPPGPGLHVTGAYIGTAHAVRRAVFLGLGMYREELSHYGAEESDFCVRLLDAGYVTKIGDVPPIHHFASPKRPPARAFVMRARNSLLWVWWNVPFPQVVAHYAGTMLNLFRHGIIRRHPLWVAWGIIRGHWAGVLTARCRRPVSARTYRTWRRLAREGPLLFDAVDGDLEPMRSFLPRESAPDRRSSGADLLFDASK